MESRRMTTALANKLYFGDNLPLLRKYIKDESIDHCDDPTNDRRRGMAAMPLLHEVLKRAEPQPQATQIELTA
jgi:hypothetical protein